VIALSAATLLVACKGKESSMADTSSAAGAVAAPIDTSHASMDTTAAAKTNNSWSDAQILAFAGAASRGEIAEAKLAETKATNPKVKAFARLMVSDHTKMLSEGNSFAKKNDITPDSTKGDVVDLEKGAIDEMKDLQTKPKGNDWDKDFIDKAIDDHKAVLEKLQQAQNATTNPALKELLTKATTKVQDHLQKAQAIKDSTLKS
jgi:putative membrane protein